jgi:hypothetical protein
MEIDYLNKNLVLKLKQKAGRKSKLTVEQKAEAQGLRDSGYTLVSIGEHFGVSHACISRNTK